MGDLGERALGQFLARVAEEVDECVVDLDERTIRIGDERRAYRAVLERQLPAPFGLEAARVRRLPGDGVGDGDGRLGGEQLQDGALLDVGQVPAKCCSGVL